MAAAFEDIGPDVAGHLAILAGFSPPQLKGAHCPGLTKEQKANYVLCSFNAEGLEIMVRAVAEEALALASLTLFLGMVAVWVEVLGVL